jgi:two-component system, OmpR family, alkaline phosphatase synthesis response regulator PhoP
MHSILIVEDEALLAQAMEEGLKDAEFDVDVVGAGDQALPKMKEKKYSLVLLDIVLPGIDGFEVLRQIKADPQLGDTKVVMLTNLGQMSEIDRAMDMGAADYVIKANIDLGKLVDLVEHKFLADM